jgi:uncharacterized protein YndB with AHSA1/START domain
MSAITDITMTQEVAAPPDRVFEAWVDPERLASWWWPHLPDTTYDLDARVGGGYVIRSRSAGIGVHGIFEVLDPPDRLELTWVWEDDGLDGPEERVAVEFSGTDHGTLVTVRHTTAAAGAAGFRQGWTDVLERLAAP